MDGAALALRDDGASLSYGDLERLSAGIARQLVRAGVRPGDRVCLLLPKSVRAVCAILGVLRTGAVYVPLDPDSPALRTARMVVSCDTDWLLANAQTHDRALELAQASGRAMKIGWMDAASPARDVRTMFDWNDVEGSTHVDPPFSGGADTPAYILFTSGSTGEPKGVVITHANVIAFLDWAIPYFGIGPGDRLSGHPPLHFDLSVFDIFGALTAGAEVHLVSSSLNLQPAAIVRMIAERELTQWFSVPGVLSLVARFDLLRDGMLPALRRVLWCGEVLPTPTLRYWMSRLPHARFTNLYGPTEATIASSYYSVPACPVSDGESIPIGAACAGEELILLGDDRRDAPPGTIGSLFIAGAGLSPGYWRDPARTAAVFIDDPRPGRKPNRIYDTGDLARMDDRGLLHFVGRADTQIKSRGYRIELGEIEAALAQDHRLRESAVVAVETGGFDNVAICCAFVGARGEEPAAAELKDTMARRLPAYMLPSRWLGLPELPRNANGKIDRPALRQLFRSRAPS